MPKDLVKFGYADAHVRAQGKRRTPHYTITGDGRAALRQWLGEEGPSIAIEVEDLVRVFFADQDNIDQLHAAVARIAANASADRGRLASVAADMDETAIGGRAGINALSIRLVSDIHAAVENWAQWAIAQTADWKSPHQDWDGARQVFQDVIGADADQRETGQGHE